MKTSFILFSLVEIGDLVKMLITGASGLLGSNLSVMYSQQFNVYSIYNEHKIAIRDCSNLKVDITDTGEMEKIKQINPHIIIHCAAFTNVDECETKRELAFRVNVEGTKNVAEAAEAIGCKLIHISTDAVFDGKKGMYTEKDEPEPVNYYGVTKLEAEKVVEKIRDALIIRTNIYGWNLLDKFSLAEWMIDKLKEGETLQAIKDVFTTPILVNDLGAALLKLLEKNAKGIYNVAGSERASKLRFAEKIAEVFGYDKKLIKPVEMKDLQLKAERGKDTSLDVLKAEKLLGRKLPNIEEGIRNMYNLMKTGYVEELKGFQ